jgi:hypothetical protein
VQTCGARHTGRTGASPVRSADPSGIMQSCGTADKGRRGGLGLPSPVPRANPVRNADPSAMVEPDEILSFPTRFVGYAPRLSIPQIVLDPYRRSVRGMLEIAGNSAFLHVVNHPVQ